jgi:hypothetical protein
MAQGIGPGCLQSPPMISFPISDYRSSSSIPSPPLLLLLRRCHVELQGNVAPPLEPPISSLLSLSSSFTLMPSSSATDACRRPLPMNPSDGAAFSSLRADEALPTRPTLHPRAPSTAHARDIVGGHRPYQERERHPASTKVCHAGSRHGSGPTC